MTTKKELFGVELQKYLTSTKEEKGIILDSPVRQTEMDRDSVIRAFRRLQLTTKNHTKRQARDDNVYYDNAYVEALRVIWESANFCCGELLHPLIAERVKFAEEIKEWKFDKVATEKLLKISIGTLKRRLPKMRTIPVRRGISTTSPSAIKNAVLLFQGSWRKVGIGSGQIDTVAHCGGSLADEFIYSMGFVDVSVGWIEYRGPRIIVE